LLAKERAGAITAEQRRRAWSAFRHDVEEDTIELISVSQATFKKANHILDQCHPKVALRSLDALHLAACDQTQDWPLCTSDTRMRQAAEVLRFDLSPLPS
jgi:predicted nucleic acid-binding protein